VQGAARAIDFYKAAFNAKELVRMPAPGTATARALLRIPLDTSGMSPRIVPPKELRKRAEAAMGGQGQK
jgi:uncharacterized glyoxalase superfamily protein PhnB